MIIAGVLSRIGTFLGSLVIIRLLGLEQVGQLGLIESWLSLATMFSLAGLGVATTRYVATSLAQNAEIIGAYAGTALCLGLILSFGVGLALFIGVKVIPGLAGMDASNLIGVTRSFVLTHVWLLLGLLVVTTLREIGVALLQGMQLFQLFVYVNLIIGVLSLPVSFLLVQAHGLAGAFGTRLILAGVELILILVFALRGLRRLRTRLSLHRLFENSRLLLGFALPTFAGQLIANPVRTFMITLLAMQPNGALQVGLLTTAGRIVGLANFIPASMATVIMPVLATDWGHNQRDRFSANVLTTLRMMWLASLPFVVFFLGATPALLYHLYGSEYVSAATITFLMLIIVLLSAINETSDRTLAAANHQWLSAGNNLVWALLFWALGLYFVPRYLGLGYSFALLMSFGLYIALQLGWLRRLFQISLRPILPLSGLSLGAITIAWWISTLRPFLLQLLVAGAFMFVVGIVQWQMFLHVGEREAFRRQARAARGTLSHRLGFLKSGP